MLYRAIIVDDEPFIREGIRKIISWDELGIEIIGCASDGQKALELLEKEPADICITDIRMPHMDGLELMQKCKDDGKNMKYIVLSGYTDFDLVKRAAQIGIENYIVKPVDRLELSQTIVSVVDKLNNELAQQAVVQEGIDILRENLLYRWITGEITPEELEERKEYIGVDLSSEYVVGILKMAVKSEAETSVSELKNMKREALERMRNFAGKQKELICVPDFGGNLILLFRDVVKKRNAIDDVIAAMIRYGEYDQKFRCFIALGNIEANKQKIDKSYYAARHVLENYELSSEKKFIWYEEIGEYMELVPAECYDRLWQITDKFSISDKEEIFNLVDEVMSDIGKMTRVRLELMQAFGLIFVSKVLQNVKNYRPNTEQKIESLLMKTTDIYHIEHLEDVIKF